MKTCPDAYHCPVEATIDIVGGKHKVLILWHLSKAGVLRFGELQRRMSQATPKMLTRQLRPRPQRHVRLGKGRAGRGGEAVARNFGGSGGLTASASRSMLGDAVSASTRRHT